MNNYEDTDSRSLDMFNASRVVSHTSALAWQNKVEPVDPSRYVVKEMESEGFVFGYCVHDSHDCAENTMVGKSHSNREDAQQAADKLNQNQGTRRSGRNGLTTF